MRLGPARVVGEVVIKARIGAGRHRELEVREWTGWRYDREQIEVSTYVYDRSAGRFRKEWREKQRGVPSNTAPKASCGIKTYTARAARPDGVARSHQG